MLKQFIRQPKQVLPCAGYLINIFVSG